MRSTIHLFVVFLFMFVTHDTVSLDCESVKANDALQFGQSIAVSVTYDCRHTNDFLTHCCTGIILSESYVLTRANCFDDLHDGDVIMVAALQNRSEAGEIIRKIDRIIIHPNATNNRSGAKDNIALLHMSTPLDFGGMNDITRACGVLHSNYSSNSKRRAVITWDLMQSKFGTMAEIKLQPNDEMCHEFIGDMQRQVCVRFQRPGKLLTEFSIRLYAFVFLRFMRLYVSCSIVLLSHLSTIRSLIFRYVWRVHFTIV